MNNTKRDTIKEQFQKEAIIYGNIWMYFIQVAVEVIERCRELNIPIHGLEAFRIQSFGIQPSQADSTWFHDKNIGNWDEAITFIESKKTTEFIFEIWYEDY